jgi:hypothetical protein
MEVCSLTSTDGYCKKTFSQKSDRQTGVLGLIQNKIICDVHFFLAIQNILNWYAINLFNHFILKDR